MPSSYKGIYVQRDESGNVVSVQVEDTSGNTMPIPPKIYNERGVEPPINELPDQPG